MFEAQLPTELLVAAISRSTSFLLLLYDRPPKKSEFVITSRWSLLVLCPAHWKTED